MVVWTLWLADAACVHSQWHRPAAGAADAAVCLAALAHLAPLCCALQWLVPASIMKGRLVLAVLHWQLQLMEVAQATAALAVCSVLVMPQQHHLAASSAKRVQRWLVKLHRA